MFYYIDVIQYNIILYYILYPAAARRARPGQDAWQGGGPLDPYK